MDELRGARSLDEVIEYCGEALRKEFGRTASTIKLNLLVCRLLSKINPDFEVRPVITRAAVFSAPAPMLFHSDPAGEDSGNAVEMEGFSVREIFTSVPEEMLGTLDENTGRFLGHPCILLWAKITSRLYFLDPAQISLASTENGIEFDHLAIIEVDKDQKEVVIESDKGGMLLYWLHPEIAVPKLPAETLSKIDRCLTKLLDKLSPTNNRSMFRLIKK